AGFLALQFFSGDVQISFYTFFLSLAHICYSRICRKSAAGFLAAAAVMLLCGALLSMVQLLPIRELFGWDADNQFLERGSPSDKASSGLYAVVIYICALTALSMLAGSRTRRLRPSFRLWASVSVTSVILGQLPPQLHAALLGWVPLYGLFPNQ